MMISNDNIFNFLKEYTFPINRGEKTTVEFLTNYFSKYIKGLKDFCIYDDKCFMPAEFYDELENKTDFIKHICDQIINIIDEYNKTNISEHHKLLSNLMEEVKDELYLKTYDITKKGLKDWYYRIRKSDVQIEEREEMFHVPFTKRYLINSYRYSIAGYPSLYLSSMLGLAWFESGMPNSFSCSMYHINPKDKKPLRLLNFSPSPISIIHAIELQFLNANTDDEKDYVIESLIRYLIMLPLVAACSLSVKNKNIKYIEEYIFPQSLLLWVKNTDYFDGILYSSCSYIEPAHSLNANNMVLPSNTIKDDYCESLKNTFMISEPHFCSVSSIFFKYKNEIEILRNFITKVMGGRQNSVFDELTAICKSLVSWYDSMISGTNDSKETLYQLVNAIVRYSYNIKKHKEHYIEFATNEAKSYYPSVEESIIKTDIEEIIKEFCTEIEPIISQFNNYCFKIEFDTSLDYKTLEHI